MPSLNDVARKAQVSVSTVSNVFNRSRFVSPELTQRVLAAATELDYHANLIAKNLRSCKTNTVGIVLTDVIGVFYPYVIKGLTHEFTRHGYDVYFFETDAMNDPLHSWEKLMEGIRHFADYRVDGIVLTSILPTEYEKYFVQQIIRIVRKGKHIPLVSLETDLTDYGIDSVCSSSFQGAECAVQHLIDLGCQRIAHITGPVFTRASFDRLSGYQSALNKAGLPADRELVSHGDYLHQSGYNAVKEILGITKFDGLFAANDPMAIGAMSALREEGFRIPEDIKVIGYDNVFISSIVDPPLSTIHVPKRSMGEAGAKLLIERIEGRRTEQTPIRIDLETRLIVRQSTDPSASDAWEHNSW